MANTIPANESNTVINEMIATLKAGTISSVSAFGNRVYKDHSVDRWKETRLSGGRTVAGIIYVGIDEFVLTDERVGNVLSLTIAIAAQNKQDPDLVLDSMNLTAAVKNLLNGDIPSTAEGFYPIDAEEMTLRITWGEPEQDSESNKQWVFVELPVSIAYVTTSKTSH